MSSPTFACPFLQNNLPNWIEPAPPAAICRSKLITRTVVFFVSSYYTYVVCT